MKALISIISILFLSLIALLSNCTFTYDLVSLSVLITNYASAFGLIIIILLCIEFAVERIRERIINAVLDNLNNYCNSVDNIKESIIDKIVDLHNICNMHSYKAQSIEKLHNEIINVKLNNNLIETHQVHEVLKEVFMLDASIAKDTQNIKNISKDTQELICFFSNPNVDNLRNSFNSTSTSNSTFKDLSQSLDEDCKDTEPIIIDEPVETDRDIIITVEEKINKKRKK